MIAYLLVFAAAAGSTGNDAVSVRIMHDYGRCVVARDQRRARELLAMDYRTDAYSKALLRLADRNKGCIPPAGQLRFHPVLFAGALAEALLERDARGSNLAQLLAVDPAKAAIPIRSDLDAMALCTIARTPANSAQLLATKPMSKDESIAIRALAPVLTDCLRKDLKVTFNRPALRSVMALTAWRIVAKPRGAAE